MSKYTSQYNNDELVIGGVGRRCGSYRFARTYFTEIYKGRLRTVTFNLLISILLTFYHSLYNYHQISTEASMEKFVSHDGDLKGDMVNHDEIGTSTEWTIEPYGPAGRLQRCN